MVLWPLSVFSVNFNNERIHWNITREGWCGWPWSAFLVDGMLQELHGRQTRWPTGLGIAYGWLDVAGPAHVWLIVRCHLPSAPLSVINLFRYLWSRLSHFVSDDVPSKNEHLNENGKLRNRSTSKWSWLKLIIQLTCHWAHCASLLRLLFVCGPFLLLQHLE